eukprot:symbB.v1.2.033181.t1/scaffold4024.1/size46069/5
MGMAGIRAMWLIMVIPLAAGDNVVDVILNQFGTCLNQSNVIEANCYASQVFSQCPGRGCPSQGYAHVVTRCFPILTQAGAWNASFCMTQCLNWWTLCNGLESVSDAACITFRSQSGSCAPMCLTSGICPLGFRSQSADASAKVMAELASFWNHSSLFSHAQLNLSQARRTVNQTDKPQTKSSGANETTLYP